MSALPDNKTVNNLVVGLGRTGFSVARHLLARGESVSVVDSRSQPPLLERLRAELPAAVWLGDLPEAFSPEFQRVVVSPGVPGNTPLLARAREAGAEVLGDVELFARQVQAPVIGVTGSNGKSTVVSLLGHLAADADTRVVVGGNLGPPVLDLLEQKADLFVLELSSFQLESTNDLNADVGLVLNVVADHLDRYSGMDDYVAAKARLVAQSRVAVLNRDDQRVRAMAENAEQCIFFTEREPGPGEFGLRQVGQAEWFARGDELLAPISQLPLAGRHNALNVLAALACLEAMGRPLEPVLDRLPSFRGLAHRMQRVASDDGICWINDSKATNLGATQAALAGLQTPVILIAGGQGKQQDFTELAPTLRDSVRALVLLGEAQEEIAAVVPSDLPIHRVGDMEAAVACARALAQEGETVLLSPACASFDQFAGFEERGRAFIAAVQAGEGGP